MINTTRANKLPGLVGVTALSGEPIAYAGGSLVFLACETHVAFLVLHWLYVQQTPMAFAQLTRAVRGRFAEFSFEDHEGGLHDYVSSQRSPGAATTSLVGSVTVRPGMGTLPAWIRVTAGRTSIVYSARCARSTQP